MKRWEAGWASRYASIGNSPWQIHLMTPPPHYVETLYSLKLQIYFLTNLIRPILNSMALKLFNSKLLNFWFDIYK